MMLMGILLASLGTFLIKACWQKCMGITGGNRHIFLLMLLVAIVCLPLLPITSLSVVPVVCCLISLTGVYFVRRKVKLLEEVLLPNQTADWLPSNFPLCFSPLPIRLFFFLPARPCSYQSDRWKSGLQLLFLDRHAIFQYSCYRWSPLLASWSRRYQWY